MNNQINTNYFILFHGNCNEKKHVYLLDIDKNLISKIQAIQKHLEFDYQDFDKQGANYRSLYNDVEQLIHIQLFTEWNKGNENNKFSLRLNSANNLELILNEDETIEEASVIEKLNLLSEKILKGAFKPQYEERSKWFSNSQSVSQNIIDPHLEILEIISNVPAIPKNFTSDMTIEEQRLAHHQAKDFLQTNLPLTGAEVKFISPPSWKSLLLISMFKFNLMSCLDSYLAGNKRTAFKQTYRKTGIEKKITLSFMEQQANSMVAKPPVPIQ